MASFALISDPLIFALLSSLSVGLIILAIAGISILRPALGMIFFFVFCFRVAAMLGALHRRFRPALFGATGARGRSGCIGLAHGVGAGPGDHRAARVVPSLEGAGPFADRPSARDDQLAGGRFGLSDVAFWLAASFVVALFLELLVKGPIPLFARMERFDYARLYGGPLHRLLLDWGPMLAFQLGLFAVAPMFRGYSPDWRFGALFASLILYLFLVGHRFSSIYAYGSFFIIPIGVARLGLQGASARPLFSRKVVIGGAIFCGLVIGAVANSYMVVRDFEGSQLAAKLSQRVLVQQGEMWWVTYERVFVRDSWDGAHAAYKLFAHPYDPGRNSTTQFLMEAALPVPRAHFILDQGSAYTGGWPEVLFELGGPIGGFVLIAMSAVIFSEFMFLLARCIVQGRFATCFFLTPILYAVLINLVSGMVNSFIQLTFSLKIAMALLVYVAEERWRSDMLSTHQADHPGAKAIVQEES